MLNKQCDTPDPMPSGTYGPGGQHIDPPTDPKINTQG